MSYKDKYLKYKNKYLILKEQLGGTAEENNNFLLHGTNLYYIDDIKKDGLTGKYNQELLDIIKKYWNNIKHLAKDPYVNYFLERLERIEKGENPSLSFTGQIAVAKEYSNGARKFGEGPSRFLSTLDRYMDENKRMVTDDMEHFYNIMYKASLYPGIILAIDKDDFEETKTIKISDLNKWEHTLNFQIPPNKLYIRRDNNDYILLNSKEGEEYIENLKNEHNEKMRRIEEEKRRIRESEDKWDEQRSDIGPLFFNELINIKRNIIIRAQYDIYDEEISPHYLEIRVANNDIYIQIIIKNILGSLDYETEIIKKNRFDLFIENKELKDKLKIVIEKIMKHIPEERREKIYNKILEIFPYINESVMEVTGGAGGAGGAGSL